MSAQISAGPIGGSWLGLDTGGTFTDAVLLAAAGASSRAPRRSPRRGIWRSGSARRFARCSRNCRRRGPRRVAWSRCRRRSPPTPSSRIASARCARCSSGSTRPWSSVPGWQRAAPAAGGPHPGRPRRHRRGMEHARRGGREAAVAEHETRVEAFAVAANFSVRNPAHELRARRSSARLSKKPVTCAHELSSKLDAPRRALTAVLNARLTPQIRHLIEALSGVLDAGIDRRAAHDRQRRRLADEGRSGARISGRDDPLGPCGERRRRGISHRARRLRRRRTWAAPPRTSRSCRRPAGRSARRARWSAAGARWSKRSMCAPAGSAATARCTSTGRCGCASGRARRCR